MQLVNPAGEVTLEERVLTDRLASLDGVTLGFVDNGKINARRYFELLGGHFQERYGVADVEIVTKENISLPASEATLQRVKIYSRAIITGVGD